jgi:hypothetical protein
MWFGAKGLEFRVEGFWKVHFRVYGLSYEIRVWGKRFWIEGLGLRTKHSEFMVKD